MKAASGAVCVPVAHDRLPVLPLRRPKANASRSPQRSPHHALGWRAGRSGRTRAGQDQDQRGPPAWRTLDAHGGIPGEQAEMQQASRPGRSKEHPVVAGQHKADNAQGENRETDPCRDREREPQDSPSIEVQVVLTASPATTSPVQVRPTWRVRRGRAQGGAGLSSGESWRRTNPRTPG